MISISGTFEPISQRQSTELIAEKLGRGEEGRAALRLSSGQRLNFSPEGCASTWPHTYLLVRLAQKRTCGETKGWSLGKLRGFCCRMISFCLKLFWCSRAGLARRLPVATEGFFCSQMNQEFLPRVPRVASPASVFPKNHRRKEKEGEGSPKLLVRSWSAQLRCHPGVGGDTSNRARSHKRDLFEVTPWLSGALRRANIEALVANPAFWQQSSCRC